MSKKIVGKMCGCYSPMGRTLILQDENGNELSTGVVVEQEQKFTATDNDVREGLTYASNEGVSTGTKNIPSYRTQRGKTAIPAGSAFSISLPEYNQYDYTYLQCMIAPYNTSIYDSCAVNKVVINDCVYMTESTEKIADVSKDSDTLSINLNIVNTTSDVYFIYYFTYREEL